MLSLTPFLLFDGNCAEAMTFYQSCFGGDLVLTPLGTTPMAAYFPPEKHQRITYAHLKSGAVGLSATDWLHPVRQRQLGNSTAIFITSADHAELSTLFQKLRDGADPEFLSDLREMPFGLYGSLTDRFQIEWVFRGDKP